MNITLTETLTDVPFEAVENAAKHGLVKIDREHRFAEGDLIAHVDETAGNASVVQQLTWRVRRGVAYPTYTIEDQSGYCLEVCTDVLCTLDLHAV